MLMKAKATPTIRLIVWVYMVLGMENFFWTAFRFLYQGVHGTWLRTGLNFTLTIVFMGFALFLSKRDYEEDMTGVDTSSGPVGAAWSLALLCMVIQFYRFALWTKANCVGGGIHNFLDVYIDIIFMHDSWIAMMAALGLAQEYRSFTAQAADEHKILNWEVTSGYYGRHEFYRWLEGSLYLEITNKHLKIKSNLFWQRIIPLENIISVTDISVCYHPRVALSVTFKEGKKDNKINFVSTDYKGWIEAFEDAGINVEDKADLRNKKFTLYKWVRFYCVAETFSRVFIALTILIALLLCLGALIFPAAS